jgi:hypothetical protein
MTKTSDPLKHYLQQNSAPLPPEDSSLKMRVWQAVQAAEKQKTTSRSYRFWSLSFVSTTLALTLIIFFIPKLDTHNNSEAYVYEVITDYWQLLEEENYDTFAFLEI